MTGGDRGDDGADVTLLNAVRMAVKEDDDEIARLPANAMASLSDGTRSQIVDAILRAQADEHSRRNEPKQVTDDGGDDALALRRPSRGSARRSIQRSTRRGWVLGAGGLAVALAAAAAFMFWMRPEGQAGALPAYFVSASGGVAELRGGKSEADDADSAATATAPVQRLRAESELRVVCRPDSAITGPLAVRAFFAQGDDIDEVVPVIQTAATGAFDLRLRGSDLLPRHRGHGSLRVVVGRPAAIRAVLPPMAAKASGDISGSTARHDDRRWLTVPLDLLDLP